jgi:hypothetical protein
MSSCLSIRYTTCQGVDPTAALDDRFQPAMRAHLALLFNLRSDFPTACSAFINGTGNYTAVGQQDDCPYFTRGESITITGFEIYRQGVTKPHATGDPATATTLVLTCNAHAQV